MSGEPSQDLTQVDTSYPDVTSRSGRLKLPDMELVLRLHKAGQTQEEIAVILQCSQSTVHRTLARLNESPQVVQAIMKGESFDVLTQWKRATRVAAKRGDHRPAREWIEAAHPELRPNPANTGGGGGVTINIGQPGQPLTLPTITIEQVSPPSRTLSALSPAAGNAVSDDHE